MGYSSFMSSIGLGALAPDEQVVAEPKLMNGSNRTIANPRGVQNGNFPMTALEKTHYYNRRAPAVAASQSIVDEQLMNGSNRTVAHPAGIQNGNFPGSVAPAAVEVPATAVAPELTARDISKLHPNDLTDAEAKTFLKKFDTAEKTGVPQTLKTGDEYVDSLNIDSEAKYNKLLKSKAFHPNNPNIVAIRKNLGIYKPRKVRKDKGIPKKAPVLDAAAQELSATQALDELIYGTPSSKNGMTPFTNADLQVKPKPKPTLNW